MQKSRNQKSIFHSKNLEAAFGFLSSVEATNCGYSKKLMEKDFKTNTRALIRFYEL